MPLILLALNLTDSDSLQYRQKASSCSEGPVDRASPQRRFVWEKTRKGYERTHPHGHTPVHIVLYTFGDCMAERARGASRGGTRVGSVSLHECIAKVRRAVGISSARQLFDPPFDHICEGRKWFIYTERQSLIFQPLFFIYTPLFLPSNPLGNLHLLYLRLHSARGDPLAREAKVQRKCAVKRFAVRICRKPKAHRELELAVPAVCSHLRR